MTATLLLIRHAEHTDYGAVLSGRRPGVALSERGREQAARLAARLAGAGVERIETSPVERAQETAAAVADACGIAAHVAASLDEIDFGAWTGRTFAELDPDPRWQHWNAARGVARCPGGEGMAEAQARIWAHLEETAAREAGRTVAMVSHCDLIRAAVARALDLPLDNLLRFDVEPASISRLVLGPWGARVISVNEPLPPSQPAEAPAVA